MSSGRILVVDDEPQIRRVLRATLTGHGYEFHEARTGEEALEAIRANRFDLVLLDVNMPGIGGLETCRAIRSGSEVAIIMLTVRDSEQDKVTALDAGADDYITKPFSTPELLARIRANLRRMPSSPEGGPQSVHLDDIEINLATRRVISGGREVRLTPKEFGLLQYLLDTVSRSRKSSLSVGWISSLRASRRVSTRHAKSACATRRVFITLGEPRAHADSLRSWLGIGANPPATP
ncbi:MAG: response regulator transcription factor [Bryobacteraceae bacterium]